MRALKGMDITLLFLLGLFDYLRCSKADLHLLFSIIIILLPLVENSNDRVNNRFLQISMPQFKTVAYSGYWLHSLKLAFISVMQIRTQYLSGNTFLQNEYSPVLM
jgi:hypothetical protein